MRKIYKIISIAVVLVFLCLLLYGCIERRVAQVPTMPIAQNNISDNSELPITENNVSNNSKLPITEDNIQNNSQSPIMNGNISSDSKSPTAVENNKLTTDIIPDTIKSPKIIVKKGERILELWDGDSLCGRYPIGLGWAPSGHKQFEGDGRTPEGTYYVCIRNPEGKFYLSLGISYPNKEDAKAALNAGIINQITYNQIADAIDNKAQPPWNTALGGEIMIHGMGSDSDWTLGCIAVNNDVMDVLWKHCPNKTAVIISP